MRIDLNGVPAISTTVKYVRRTDLPPRTYYAIAPPPGEPVSTVEIDPHEMRVHEVSGLKDAFDLSEDGVCFLEDMVDFADFDDDASVREVLYPQILSIARDLLDVQDATVISHGIRRRSHGLESALSPQTGADKPQVGDLTHGDFTPYSASLALAKFGAEAAERLSRGRFSIHNFWWPIRGPLVDYPLALCLPQSIAGSDFIEIQSFFFKRGPTPILGFVHHPDHQWIYRSGMKENEMMVFRTFDTEMPLSRFVPHAAIVDPGAGEDVLPRESFEVRVLSLY